MFLRKIANGALKINDEAYKRVVYTGKVSTAIFWIYTIGNLIGATFTSRPEHYLGAAVPISWIGINNLLKTKKRIYEDTFLNLSENILY